MLFAADTLLHVLLVCLECALHDPQNRPRPTENIEMFVVRGVIAGVW
jgi:hypothetical protein